MWFDLLVHVETNVETIETLVQYLDMAALIMTALTYTNTKFKKSAQQCF